MLYSSLLYGCNAMQQPTLKPLQRAQEPALPAAGAPLEHVYACSSQCEQSPLLIYTGLC